VALRALGASLLLAAAAVAADRDFTWSPYADILVATCLLLGLIALGWFAGRPAIWIFSVCLVLESVAYTVLFWDDDPARSGIDDLSPAVLFLLLPVAWAAIGAGVAGRRLTSGFRP
jgi:hypothetical protein